MRKCSTIVNATRKFEDKGDKDVNIIIATTKQNKEREKERGKVISEPYFSKI